MEMRKGDYIRRNAVRSEGREQEKGVQLDNGKSAEHLMHYTRGETRVVYGYAETEGHGERCRNKKKWIKERRVPGLTLEVKQEARLRGYVET